MSTIEEKRFRPNGLWESPVSPALIGVQLRFNDLAWDSDDDTLLWVEGRSDKNILVSKARGEAIRDLTYEGSVRGGVGYGGGEFSVAHGKVVFALNGDRIYRRGLGYDAPHAISASFGDLAAPTLSPDGRWVLFVRSSPEREDSVGLVSADGHGWPACLVSGSDFYMQPVWHPQGKRIAWIEWDHPNMPWDGTRLKLASLAGDPPNLAQAELVAGGPDVPVFQPAFSPDGRWLSYIAEEGEWDRLYLLNLETGERRALVEGGNLARPAWVQGIRTYGWSPSSQSIYYLLNDAGFASLWKVDLDSGRSARIDVGPYTWLSQIAVSSRSERVALIAEGAAIPRRVIIWDEQGVEVVRRSDPESISPDDLPQVRALSWYAPDGTLVHGLYSPPSNALNKGSGLPPAIIYVHGGPTSGVVAGYDADMAFFTSRGYAWLSVNYRGSTGYGRSYMLKLREHWGDLDVEDAVGGAQALVDQGLADPHRLVIKGGSAGGYTVLNALIRCPGFFKAGLCSYGVANLFTLDLDTHKFEEHYNATMIGMLPEAAERYRAWSPIFHADQIQDALAVFQGSIDRVVVPEHSESIVSVLRQRGVPHIYRLYEGEGHGFRRTDTLISFYQDVDRFLLEHVIFNP
jgi:dipeptidyl aminopeptidase/acylaminoacyl peptidase